MMRCIQCHIPCDPWDHAPPCPAPFFHQKPSMSETIQIPTPKPYILFFIIIICIQWHIPCVPQGSHCFNLIFCKMLEFGWGCPWVGASMSSWHISSFAYFPKPKGQLIWKLIGSIGMICWSKIAKIVPIGNPRWWPSWKSIFRFFFGTERPIDSKLGRKHRSDL